MAQTSSEAPRPQNPAAALPTTPSAAATAAVPQGAPGPPTGPPVEDTAARAAPLFEVPPGRLGGRLHEQVFGVLPAATARALDTSAVAAAVRPLLACGWRPAQLAARVGALPVSEAPEAAVVAFLQQLADRESPRQAWDREWAERGRVRAGRAEEAARAASEASRAHWVAEARRGLGLPPPTRRAVAPRVLPRCSGCGSDGEFFVTRQVRLCTACVALLASGQARLGLGARAG